jgi:uncharacterized protein DUF4230
MSEIPRASIPPPRPGFRVGHILVILSVLALVVTCGMLVDRCAGRFFAVRTESERPSTPSVVAAVRDLARLESACYHMERVIDLADRQEHLFGLVHAQDAILLVAAADVTAGIDLGELREGDVTIDPKRHRAHLSLPRPQVFSTRLDSEHTYVHTRQTDVLARRREDLETRARQEAERTLREAAVRAGILEHARDSAAHTVESLVRSLGYERVTISWARQ